MNCITAETLAQVSQELIANPSLERMMDHLEAHQPRALHYVMDALQDHGSESGMKATQLAWFALRAFQLQADKPIPRLSRETLLAHDSATNRLAERATDDGLQTFLEIMSLETSAQPYLMEFVRRSVATSLRNPNVDRTEAKKCVAVYLAVKTVVDALDAATN